MVRDHYPVTYDCDKSKFVVHRADSGKPNMVFCMHSSGLHIYDPDNTVFSFITTVNGNKAHFTKHQIEGAEKARSLHASLGSPSQCDFKWIVQSNQIVDCPMHLQDVKTANKIWGPSIASLKGKTTRRTPLSVVIDIVQVPKEIRKLHQNVILSINIFFVNKIPFIITLSRNIQFTTVTHLADQKASSIFKALRGIIMYYYQKGFQVTAVTGDGEFVALNEMMVELPGAP